MLLLLFEEYHNIYHVFACFRSCACVSRKRLATNPWCGKSLTEDHIIHEVYLSFWIEITRREQDCCRFDEFFVRITISRSFALCVCVFSFLSFCVQLSLVLTLPLALKKSSCALCVFFFFFLRLAFLPFD